MYISYLLCTYSVGAAIGFVGAPPGLKGTLCVKMMSKLQMYEPICSSS